MDFVTSEKAIEQYRSTLGSELVDFFLSMWKNQSESTPKVTWTPGGSKEMLRAFIDGRPMLSVNTPQIDRGCFVHALGRTLETMHGHPAVDAQNPPAIMSVDLETVEQGDLADAIIDPAVTAWRISRRLDLTSDLDRVLLSFAVVSTLQPFAAVVAVKLIDDIPSPDLKASGMCPVCGSPAAIGVIGDDEALSGGKRHLWCALCDTEWRYPRVKCVRCGDSSQGNLHYYYDEADEGHRIHVCDTCGGTIPVAHQGLLRHSVTPRVEEIAMLDLHAAVMADGAVLSNFAEAARDEADASASQE